MEKQQTEVEVQRSEMALSARELIILSNLFLHRDFPHCSVTLEFVSLRLQVSKATAATVMKGLVRKGAVVHVKSFISFFEPVADYELRRQVLRMLGLVVTP